MSGSLKENTVLLSRMFLRSKKKKKKSIASSSENTTEMQFDK